LSPAAILIFGPIPSAAKDQPKLVLALLVERGVESLRKSVVVHSGSGQYLTRATVIFFHL